MRYLRRSPFVLLSTAIVSSCVVGPDYGPPEDTTPDIWYRELEKGLETGDAPLHSWWLLLEDETLNSLIQRAAAGNLDLKAAWARIMEARALLGMATGQRYPELDAGGTYQRFEISQARVPPGTGNELLGVGLSASWEIDLWGRFTRDIESANAELQATIEDYRDVLVLLYSDIAVTYLEMRALQARIRYIESNVELQESTLKLTNDRFRAEISSELDVRQAELNLERTSALAPALRIREQQAMYRIAVLLGEHPGALQEELSSEVAIPQPPEKVTITFPAEILRQRPDIRRAERMLASETAEIGVATADLYPRLSITGFFGYDNTASGNLFSPEFKSWQVGPSITWPIFAGGQIRSNIEAAKEAAEQARIAYEQTVLLALEEVEGSLVAYSEEINRRDALQRSVTAAERSVTLVETLYRTGVTDFQNVLDMQRSLVQQQQFLANSEGLVVQNLVQVYKALGGGWQPAPQEASPAPAGEAAAPAAEPPADDAREDGDKNIEEPK